MRTTRIFSLIVRHTIVAAFLGTAVACSTPQSEIFESFDLEDGTSLSTDARQRLILNTSPEATPRPGLVQPKQIVCAEPSPDVAATVANSFGVGWSILDSGSGSISASEAEGLIQLAERTVTIQLLRDQMYRACEAYANGAITGTTYSLITSKNNKTMVSLLLGETAGGAVGRKLGALGASADAQVRSSMQGLAENSLEARQAAADLQQAETELSEAEGLPDSDSTKAGKVELAEAKRDEAAQALQHSTLAVSNSTAEVGTVIAGGNIDLNESAELAAVLREMQEQFLRSDFLEDFVSTCLVELGLNSEQKSFFDPVNVVFRTKHLEYEGRNRSAQRRENDAARRALETAIIRLNDSYLSRLCKDELPTLLQTRQLQNKRTAIGEYEIKMAVERRAALTGLTEALKECAAISDDVEARASCRDAALSLVTSRPLDEDTTSGPNTHSISPLNSLDEIPDLSQLWRSFLSLTQLHEWAHQLHESVGSATTATAPHLSQQEKEHLAALKLSFLRKYDRTSAEITAELSSESFAEIDEGITTLKHEYRLTGTIAADEVSRVRRQAQMINDDHERLSKDMRSVIREGTLYLGAREYFVRLAQQSAQVAEN